MKIKKNPLQIKKSFVEKIFIVIFIIDGKKKKIEWKFTDKIKWKKIFFQCDCLIRSIEKKN